MTDDWDADPLRGCGCMILLAAAFGGIAFLALLAWWVYRMWPR